MTTEEKLAEVNRLLAEIISETKLESVVVDDYADEMVYPLRLIDRNDPDANLVEHGEIWQYSRC